ncbi:MAG: hypothetical protein IJ822_00485, partial [Pyramidobacter sp.]|nr:hypothetical protein [Pyramidobacter sp.]
ELEAAPAPQTKKKQADEKSSKNKAVSADAESKKRRDPQLEKAQEIVLRLIAGAKPESLRDPKPVVASDDVKLLSGDQKPESGDIHSGDKKPVSGDAAPAKEK